MRVVPSAFRLRRRRCLQFLSSTSGASLQWRCLRRLRGRVFLMRASGHLRRRSCLTRLAFTRPFLSATTRPIRSRKSGAAIIHNFQPCIQLETAHAKPRGRLCASNFVAALKNFLKRPG
ncbi:hypothetical protein TRVL_08884 [Trypanosoma vivax]|nr:hypothetical protein TRVL_08884 [Trypanosoma vivax]